MQTHVWPTRSYPTECAQGTQLSPGPEYAKHFTQFRSFDKSKRYQGDYTWLSWRESGEFKGFDMEAGDEILVTMEMDWKSGATRDASLVFWSDGADNLDIEPVTNQTKSPSQLPFTSRRASDGNALNENTSDACFPNPQKEIF